MYTDLQDDLISVCTTKQELKRREVNSKLSKQCKCFRGTLRNTMKHKVKGYFVVIWLWPRTSTKRALTWNRSCGARCDRVISCVVESISRVKLSQVELFFTQLEAAQSAYREASGSQAGTSQTPTRYLKPNRITCITHITCQYVI